MGGGRSGRRTRGSSADLAVMRNINAPFGKASDLRECQSGSTSVSVSLVNSEIDEVIPLRNLSKPIRIKLPFRNISNEKLACAFWNSEINNLSSEGCKLVHFITNNNNTTFCECNHATDFLMQFLPPIPPLPK